MLGLKLNHVSKRGHCCLVCTCPSATLLNNGWTEFHENFRIVPTWHTGLTGTYGYDVYLPRMTETCLAFANYDSSMATYHTGWSAVVACGSFTHWFILPFCVTSKGVMFVFELMQLLAASSHILRTCMLVHLLPAYASHCHSMYEQPNMPTICNQISRISWKIKNAESNIIMQHDDSRHFLNYR